MFCFLPLLPFPSLTQHLTPQIDKAGLTLSSRPTLDKDYELDELEMKLEELEAELLEIISNGDRLRRSHSELVELQLVLEKAGAFFDQARTEAGSHQDEYGSGGSGR